MPDRRGRTGPGLGRDPHALQGMLDATPDAMVIADARGRVALVNDRVETMLGYARCEMVGRPATAFASTDTADLLEAELADFFVHPSMRLLGTSAQLWARRKDDVEFPIEIAVSPLDHEGASYVVATVRDITHKRREELLFRELLEAAPDAMVIVDANGEILLVNAQVERLFGYARTDLVGKPVEMLVPDRFAGMHDAFRRGYLSEPRTRPMGLAGDLFARRADGREFPAEISLAPLQTEDGLLVSAAVRDISERRRMQEDNNRVKDEFFATVSHELRTPLTTVIGYTELLGDLEELSPQGHRFLSVVARSAERELRLVDDLLTLAEIEDSGLAIRAVALDLETVVQNAVEVARPPAEETALELSLEIPGFPVPVSGDVDRLGQALDNLISNAIKFTPSGGAVKVSLRTGEGYAEVDVADSGSGIAETDPDRLFERFYRTSDAYRQQIPGAGLGLPIAKAIVEAHEGTISVHSTRDRGSTFRVRLPLS